jgi:hypothetical protein
MADISLAIAKMLLVFDTTTRTILFCDENRTDPRLNFGPQPMDISDATILTSRKNASDKADALRNKTSIVRDSKHVDAKGWRT